MAGTIPLSMTQQLDEFGAPLVGGHLYLIQAGTTSTPQNGFQDSALTLPLPNPIILDASGRLPQFFLADGSIKIRLTDVNGQEKLVADGLIVTGASSGGGGGSPVDPTTVLQTGWLQAIYGVGVVTGFVRCNARTIGSATSGATERANADTQALFNFLWNGDPNLSVSTGRGASSAADWAANKTIALPDFRSRALAGLGDMGNIDNTLFSGATFTSGTSVTLGSLLGSSRRTLTSSMIPSLPLLSGTTASSGALVKATSALTQVTGPSPPVALAPVTGVLGDVPVSGTVGNVSPATFDTISPYGLVTIYVKL